MKEEQILEQHKKGSSQESIAWNLGITAKDVNDVITAYYKKKADAEKAQKAIESAEEKAERKREEDEIEQYVKDHPVETHTDKILELKAEDYTSAEIASYLYDNEITDMQYRTKDITQFLTKHNKKKKPSPPPDDYGDEVIEPKSTSGTRKLNQCVDIIVNLREKGFSYNAIAEHLYNNGTTAKLFSFASIRNLIKSLPPEQQPKIDIEPDPKPKQKSKPKDDGFLTSYTPVAKKMLDDGYTMEQVLKSLRVLNPEI